MAGFDSYTAAPKVYMGTDNVPQYAYTPGSAIGLQFRLIKTKRYEYRGLTEDAAIDGADILNSPPSVIAQPRRVAPPDLFNIDYAEVEYGDWTPVE